MKRIMTVAIETLFMLTLFAAGWFALVVFQLLTNPIPYGNIGYKMRNKEVVMTTNTAEYAKKWRTDNREKVLEAKKRYSNSEKGRAARKRYIEENKDAVRASNRKANAVWRKKNPEKVREYNAKYNDAKRIEKAYDEWNDTLRELGYGDLV